MARFVSSCCVDKGSLLAVGSVTGLNFCETVMSVRHDIRNEMLTLSRAFEYLFSDE